jgi:hypothetical protein
MAWPRYYVSRKFSRVTKENDDKSDRIADVPTTILTETFRKAIQEHYYYYGRFGIEG